MTLQEKKEKVLKAIYERAAELEDAFLKDYKFYFGNGIRIMEKYLIQP